MKKILLPFFLFSIISLLSFSQDNARLSDKVVQEKTFLQKAKPELIADFQNGKNEFWIMLTEQADVSDAKLLRTKDEKGEYVFNKLTETASRTQAVFLPILKSKAESFQQYWIANAIFVKGSLDLAKELSTFDQVKELLPNTKFYMEQPIDITLESAKQDESMVAIEWGVNKINAPLVWALGYKGQGVVVAGQDSGIEWDHLALQDQYRGWNGVVADHNFNWHDAIHTGSGGSCGLNSMFPCDDHNHGTHTMGTIVGDDQLGNQVGIAPSAKWIGCRNMDGGVGTPTTYIECFQWLLAPTNLNNQNPTPSKAPHVINNSWGCDATEGCIASNYSNMETAITNLRAAGVVVVASAGNDGPGCNTINGPPAHFDGAFTVGSTTSSDAISSFSSRGNVNVDGSGRIKPNVCAPGSSVRSCIRNGTYATMSGTSMAGPHVVGAVALLISAVPSLAGQVDTIESILQKTAVHITSTQTCNGTSPSTFPNNTVGYGRIDILAAVNYAIAHNPTGVANYNPHSNGITVFPTPAKDQLFARIDVTKDKEADIQLLNTTGQLVSEKTASIENNFFQIPISELSKGFYIYCIKTSEKTYYGKFIKE
jgi:subtilisin family serine protease